MFALEPEPGFVDVSLASLVPREKRRMIRGQNDFGESGRVSHPVLGSGIVGQEDLKDSSRGG